jgi:hypothetical protein
MRKLNGKKVAGNLPDYTGAKMKKYAAAAAATLILTGCGGGSSTGGLDAEASYTIALSQASEVPTPKASSAQGIATIIVYPSSIDYQVSASSINNVTMAHIHNGAPGVIGTTVVTLYNNVANPISPSGVFASGTLTDATLPSGVTIASLKALIASGNAYVNVHTTLNPTGEIRGQIR